MLQVKPSFPISMSTGRSEGGCLPLCPIVLRGQDKSQGDFYHCCPQTPQPSAPKIPRSLLRAPGARGWHPFPFPVVLVPLSLISIRHRWSSMCLGGSPSPEQKFQGAGLCLFCSVVHLQGLGHGHAADTQQLLNERVNE